LADDRESTDGALECSEGQTHFGREERLEGKYVIATREEGRSVLDAVALYEELTDVEGGFRQLKDVMAMRPIGHRVEPRVKAHIVVTAPALLVQRLLGRRLEEAGVDLSPARAMQALSTVRLVTFRLEGQPERRGMGRRRSRHTPGPARRRRSSTGARRRHRLAPLGPDLSAVRRRSSTGARRRHPRGETP
jgi:hypothetical protein